MSEPMIRTPPANLQWAVTDVQLTSQGLEVTLHGWGGYGCGPGVTIRGVFTKWVTVEGA